jgi:hypothetical protein
VTSLNWSVCLVLLGRLIIHTWPHVRVYPRLTPADRQRHRPRRWCQGPGNAGSRWTASASCAVVMLLLSRASFHKKQTWTLPRMSCCATDNRTSQTVLAPATGDDLSAGHQKEQCIRVIRRSPDADSWPKVTGSEISQGREPGMT